MAKIRANAPCPCGSGLKYKRCHGRRDGVPTPADAQRALQASAVAERIRQSQQGLGRPIIGAKVRDQQLVIVGGQLFWSHKWKTFPDFLDDYIKVKLGREWGNAEIAKPLADRHPLMQWYDASCRYRAQAMKEPGEVVAAEINGVSACYLGVAYALYLLAHNVELQARLLNRLKDPGNFQGAYYELFVASVLIRAGFTLTLEDETNPEAKHCEFAAISKTTGKRYWVEAKMRAVSGLLGRTDADGGLDNKPLSRLIPHLNAAFKKPAEDERLIFIDLNAAPALTPDGKPTWVQPTVNRIDRYERTELADGATAYVFVTNVACHRQLDIVPSIAAYPFGLGMPDFNRSGPITLGDYYRQKQKHLDIYEIGGAISGHLRFPTTFDGRLPSEAFGRDTSRVVIGESYFFPDLGEGGAVGTVTEVTVDEVNKELVIIVSEEEDGYHLLRAAMSEADFAEYLEFREAYLGRMQPRNANVDGPFELFEWFMQVHKEVPREKLLKNLASHPLRARLEELSDEELRITYCERMVANVQAMNAKSQAPVAKTAAGPADGP